MIRKSFRIYHIYHILSVPIRHVWLSLHQSESIRICKYLRIHQILGVRIREAFTLKSIRIPNSLHYTKNPEIGDCFTERL